MSLYTLGFGEDAAGSRDFGPADRLDAAVRVMAAVGSGDDNAVMVLPAGYVLATSAARRDEWAEGLASASRATGVGFVFGIDVLDAGSAWRMEHRPRSFAYACDRGRRLLWCASPTGRGALPGDRTVTIGALRATVLFARELLAAAATAAVELARPELVIVLGHGGPTKRWVAPLAALDALAPTLVVHQTLHVCRPVQAPVLRGWQPTIARGPVGVVSYHREPDGAGAPVVGH